MTSFKIEITGLVAIVSTGFIIAGCVHRATTPVADIAVECRSIAKMKTEQISPHDVVARLHLDLESVTALGEGHYRIVVRSRTDADCADVIARLNADVDVSYAVTDERKRAH